MATELDLSAKSLPIFFEGSFWHAADTAPLEGLPILRCAIYDPLDWKGCKFQK